MKKLLFFLFIIFSMAAYCQTTEAPASQVEMADKFREEGKIYVVVAVVLIVLIGLLIYVIALDKKISKIEKEVNSEKVSK
jgi:uncharacterized membrane protein